MLFATSFIVIGILASLKGAVFGGLWLVFIGWFLIQVPWTSISHNVPRPEAVSCFIRLRHPLMPVAAVASGRVKVVEQSEWGAKAYAALQSVIATARLKGDRHQANLTNRSDRRVRPSLKCEAEPPNPNRTKPGQLKQVPGTRST
jgi:hypothetical protein